MNSIVIKLEDPNLKELLEDYSGAKLRQEKGDKQACANMMWSTLLASAKQWRLINIDETGPDEALAQFIRLAREAFFVACDGDVPKS